MKSFHIPFTIFAGGFFLLVLIGAFFGCVSGRNYIESNRNLQINIQTYNDAFEAKHSGSAEIFVQHAVRETFKKEYRHIKKRVTFDETEPMKIEYFKDGVSVKQSDSGPEEDFNEALLTISYSVVISPSNRVKGVTVKQRWIKEGERWVVIPDLKPFSK